MYWANIESIENLYKDKSFSVLSTQVNSSIYLAFDFDNFQSLITLLKEIGIKILYVELYDKSTYNYIPPDFWFNGTELDDCYLELQEFLGTLIDCNNQYYAVEIKTDNPQALQLKTALDKIALQKPPLNKKW